MKQLSKLIGNVEDPRTRKPSYDLFVTVENFYHCGSQTSSEDDSFQHRPQKLRLPRFSWKMKPWLKFCLVADLVFKTLLSESFWSDATTFQWSFEEGMIFFIPLCIFWSSIATSFLVTGLYHWKYFTSNFFWYKVFDVCVSVDKMQLLTHTHLHAMIRTHNFDPYTM